MPVATRAPSAATAGETAAPLASEIASPRPDAAPARVKPAAVLFDPVLLRTPAARVRSRVAWTSLSTVLQAALMVGIAAIARPLVTPEKLILVPVKMIRTAPPAARPGPPPPPAPAPKPRDRPLSARKAPPPMALIQPRELPPELKPPDPSEPIEDVEYGDGSGGGVIGGIPGGVVSEAPAPVQAPAPRGPVKYESRTMSPPVLVVAPALEYTQEALEREIEGTMVVECVVDVNGSVHACRVLKSLPYLDRAAIANLERRRYRPATLGGEPLAVEYTFTLRFKLP